MTMTADYARRIAGMTPSDRPRELADLIDRRAALDDRRAANSVALRDATDARRAAFIADPAAKDLAKQDMAILTLERNAADLEATISDLDKQIAIARTYVGRGW